MYFIKQRHYIALFAVAMFGLGGCALDSQNLTTIGSSAASTATTIHENKKGDLARARRFANSREVALRRDAARGDGEVIVTFAALLHAHDPREFSTWMQAHYAQLYPDTPEQSDLVTRVVALR